MRIILSRPTDVGSGTSTPGLRVSLPVLSTAAAGGTGRQNETLRAAAAAAALIAPDRALDLVKVGQDSPAELLGEDQEPNKVSLGRVIAAIDRARLIAPPGTPSQAVVAAARAVGVSPRLAHAAFTAIGNDADLRDDTLKWVAQIDVGLLERAAKAGNSRRLLDEHAASSQGSAVVELAERVNEQGAKIDALAAEVTEIRDSLKRIEARNEARSTSSEQRPRPTEAPGGGGPKKNT